MGQMEYIKRIHCQNWIEFANNKPISTQIYRFPMGHLEYITQMYFQNWIKFVNEAGVLFAISELFPALIPKYIGSQWVIWNISNGYIFKTG